ncbi:hypothetical protein [Rhizobium sp. FKL33]|uniref:hypothetical protein n=1 Tax=Rhizobium sp. FKL33 TaxID=2562307 RepID=UPI0010BFEF72|nr:hypothetical protein [Rhizobium sp. FKL33]
MRRRVFVIMGLGLASLVASCAIGIAPGAVTARETVATRPTSTITGLTPSSSDGWRKVAVTLGKSAVQQLRARESTFFVVIDDCGSRDRSFEELYVNGVSTAQLSTMKDADFDGWQAALPDPVVGYLYMPADYYAAHPKICGVFSGGSMIGAKVREKAFRIK